MMAVLRRMRGPGRGIESRQEGIFGRGRGCDSGVGSCWNVQIERWVRELEKWRRGSRLWRSHCDDQWGSPSRTEATPASASCFTLGQTLSAAAGSVHVTISHMGSKQYQLALSVPCIATMPSICIMARPLSLLAAVDELFLGRAGQANETVHVACRYL